MTTDKFTPQPVMSLEEFAKLPDRKRLAIMLLVPEAFEELLAVSPVESFAEGSEERAWMHRIAGGNIPTRPLDAVVKGAIERGSPEDDFVSHLIHKYLSRDAANKTRSEIPF